MQPVDREIWYHEPLLDFLDFVGAVKVMKASRGAGKTRGIAEDILDRARALPRGRIWLASYQYDMIWQNNLPEIYSVFELHGLKEGEHFVVNRVPPAHFDQPRKKLIDPTKSMTIFNGFCVQFIAVAMSPKKHRGKSYDGGIIDEGLLFTKPVVDGILIPTLRGINFWKSPYWKMLSIYSSQPRDPEGEWFLKYKALAEKNPKKYFYIEATAYDNLPVLGDGYIEDQREIMNPVDFQIEILNKAEVTNLPDQYYHKFDPEAHCYHADDRRIDVISSEHLTLEFDFGGRYSCFTVSQYNPFDHTEYILDEFDTNQLTEEEKMMAVVKKLKDIVRDFIKAYRNHNNKVAVLKGDVTGLDRQINDDFNIYEQIVQQLTEAGWDATIDVVRTNNPLHKTRYYFMNQLLEGSVAEYPRLQINASRCPNTILSLKRTRITEKFEKDKREERNQHADQSKAPHLSDTLDYLLFDRYYGTAGTSDAIASIGSGLDTM